jgi:hypothetical protein
MKTYDYTNYSQVLVCGDIHGNFDLVYTNPLIQDTLIIVAGDCGFGFHTIEYYEQLYRTKMNKHLSRNNNTILFIRGNHDDPTYFDGKKFNHRRAICIPDYSLVKTASHIILCIGGAISIDRIWRKRMMEQHNKPLYWEKEKPVLDTEKLNEITNGGIKIDTVITHSCPSFCKPTDKSGVEAWIKQDSLLDRDLDYERLTMTDLYNTLKEHYHPLCQWWYGHYHFSSWECHEGCFFRLLDIGEMDYLR